MGNDHTNGASGALDINNDGVVDFRDAIAAAKKAAKGVSGVLDVNGDGVVDHLDAIAAAKIAGMAVVGLGATATAGAVCDSDSNKSNFHSGLDSGRIRGGNIWCNHDGERLCS